jgi:hypothetical protein
MNIVWISGNENESISETVKYTGKKVQVKRQLNKS